MRNVAYRIRQIIKPKPRSDDRTKLSAADALKVLDFICKTDYGVAWAGLEKRFDDLSLTAPTPGPALLPPSRFARCLGMKEELAAKLFQVLAQRMNISGGFITKAQLKQFWDQISDQSFESRLSTFFNMVDKDADGRITEKQVQEIIMLSSSANKQLNIQKQVDEFSRLVMEELDPGQLGYITVEKLQMLLLQGPSQALTGGIENQNSTIMWREDRLPTRGFCMKRWYRNFLYFLLDNWQRIWVMALWTGVMASLFSYKYIQFRNRATSDVMGCCVSLAKGAAETLKLNMALKLLTVCSYTINWLRTETKLGVIVPFADIFNFQKVIAVAIGLGIGMHVISHLACGFPRLLNASKEKYKPMEQFFGEQPTSYWQFAKGWEVVTGVVMVVLVTIAFTMASSWFRNRIMQQQRPFNKRICYNAFLCSHHLFIVVYGLLVIHGIKLYLIHEWYKKTTWMYLAVPVILYAGERLIWAKFRMKAVSIFKAVAFPGDMMILHMSKPHGFKFRSGQYILVNCAAVSAFEWQRFTITSAPWDDYVTIHVRTDRTWRRDFVAHLSQGFSVPQTGHGEVSNLPRVLIDGPYGTSMQDYKDYDVVLLIGLGIGAAPMISIIREIVNNTKTMEEDEEENALEEGMAKMKPNRRHEVQFRTRKVYFYWVFRERESWDYFKDAMDEISEMDHQGIIEMHSCCTSRYEEGGTHSAAGTAMLQPLNHTKNEIDVAPGNQVASHLYSIPKWRAVYKRIQLNHPTSVVGVFYCGAPVITEELRYMSSDFSHTTTTKFEFHDGAY